MIMYFATNISEGIIAYIRLTAGGAVNVSTTLRKVIVTGRNEAGGVGGWMDKIHCDPFLCMTMTKILICFINMIHDR